MLFLSRAKAKLGLFFLLFLFTLAAFCVQAAEPAEKIDINTASLEELQKITGVGPVMGQRIIEARPFISVQDLIKVKGIGEITLQKITDQGLAWVSREIKTESIAQEYEPVVDNAKQQSQKSYASGIIINEILPSPEGQDEKEEWIEIFNQNSFEANLSYWQITDLIGQTQGYRFPEGSAIEPEGFFLLFRPTTKITLNNHGDELRLLRPGGG